MKRLRNSSAACTPFPQIETDNLPFLQRQFNLEAHPFQNSVILQIIISHLNSAEDLARFRLVCQLWKDLSLTKWRATATPFLVQTKAKASKPPTENHQETVPFEAGLSLAEFTQLYKQNFQSLQQKPFRKFILKNWKLDRKNESVSERYFWDQISPQMSSLRLENCSTANVISDRLLKILFIDTPNLQELSLLNNKFKQPPYGIIEDWLPALYEKSKSMTGTNANLLKLEIIGTAPFNFSSFAHLLPNLERLKLRGCFGKRFLHREEPFGTFPPIKHLDLMDQPNELCCAEILLQDLKSSEFPLEFLGFHLGIGMDFEFNTVLERYAATLKVLKVHKNPSYPAHYSFNVPTQMPLMEEINIWGNVTDNFSFLVMMPNLQKIHIDLEAFELWDGTPFKKTHCHEHQSKKDMLKNAEPLLSVCRTRMTFLHYLHVDHEFSKTSLKSLAKMTPGLRTLHVIADNMKFCGICSWWKGLEEVYLLFGSSVDDEGIIGWKGVGKKPAKKFANITTLKTLKRFKLEAFCYEGKLTDVSVHEGFLNAENLESISIYTSPLLTEAGEALLRKKIRTVSVLRNHNEVHGGECCHRMLYREAMHGPLVEEEENEEVTLVEDQELT